MVFRKVFLQEAFSFYTVITRSNQGLFRFSPFAKLMFGKKRIPYKKGVGKMGKETLTLVFLLVSGLLFGSIIGEILSPWLPFLAKSKEITWSPAADLEILKYELNFQVKLNLASIGGLALAFWIHRRIK